MNRVSIVTPFHNGAGLLPDYEAAVRDADEVVVVDNASGPYEAALLRSMAERLGGRYIRNETNCWFGAATNQGIRAAMGDIIVALNSDVIGTGLHPGDWIKQVREDVRDGELVGPEIGTRGVTPWGMPSRYIVGWCVAATRATWRRLGGFDHLSYPLPYSEDDDLSIRAESVGIRLMRRDWPIQHKLNKTTDTTSGAKDGILANNATALRRLWRDRQRRAESAIAVVQLGRIGDILIALPIMKKWHDEGWSVYHVVHDDFLPLVENLSYLSPVPHRCDIWDVGAGVKVAETLGCRKVIASQVDDGTDPRRPAADRNFCLDVFRRAGVDVDLYNKLPLVLDNRNARRERALIDGLIGSDDRPLILFNTTGISSPYPYRDRIAAMLGQWSGRCRLLDLGVIRVEHFQDLLALYGRATVLVSTDTATLHLAYATGTGGIPTVALVQDNDPFYSSEPRSNWIARVTYSESATDAGLGKIEAAVAAKVGQPTV